MAAERYLDPEENVEDRVKDLLGRMTLEEKLGQLLALPGSFITGDDVHAELSGSANVQVTDGLGFLDLGSSAATTDFLSAATFVNELQHWLLNNTRLGIPALVHLGRAESGSEIGLARMGGVRFPEGLGLAATFSPAGAREMAREIRDQLCAVGVRMSQSPMMDVGRDPRWQRIESSVGEDPYLAGRMAVAFVRGLQSEVLRDGVAAIGKHFVGHGLSVGGLAHAPIHLGRRQLREIFAEPFAAAIRDADIACIMSAPNSIDGLAASASHLLLTELLRDDLGFAGLVVSDENALELLVSHHGVAADAGDAAAKAIAAGMDVEFPHGNCFGSALAEQISAGSVDMSHVNRAVRRVLRLKIRLGLFEEPMVDAARSAARFATPKQRDLARGLAAQSMVLLKNSADVLPLSAAGRISVIGPTAAADDWSARRGIEDRAGSTAVIRAARGCELAAGNAELLSEACELGRDSDVIVLVLGGGHAGRFAEAGRLDLPAAQRELLTALKSCGAPIVCVLAGGRTYALESVVYDVDALVLAWSPGEQGGAALADLLFGDVSFSGKLPVTLVRHVGQVPAYYNRKAGGRADVAAEPLFPFGFGLSYSQFEYSELQCPESVDTHGVLRVAFTLGNSSEQDADEVVQIYGRDLVASVARPVRQLIGFNRVSVPAGEIVTCKFRIDLSQFAYFDEAMDFVVEPGDVELQIGSSSDTILLQQKVRLTGERRLLSQRQIVATQATAP